MDINVRVKHLCGGGGVVSDGGGNRLCIGIIVAAAVSTRCVAFGELCSLCALAGMVIGVVSVVVVIVFDFGCSYIGECNSSASSDSSCSGANVGGVSDTAFVLIKNSNDCGCSAKCGAAALHT